MTRQASYAHPCLVGGCYVFGPLSGALVPPYLLEEIPHWLIVYSKGTRYFLNLKIILQYVNIKINCSFSKSRS